MNHATKFTPAISSFRLQFLVFFIVAAAFTNVYITQPVLPIIENEFTVGATKASLTISALIFGIALSNLPWGGAADKFSIKPIILIGGVVVAAAGIFCAASESIEALIVGRLIQGLFIPCATTCVAAYLSKTLPRERLNVVMGSYVAATVAGGLGGRLIGGFIHPPLHWRYAVLTAAVLILVATVSAFHFLPEPEKRAISETDSVGFLSLLYRPELIRIFLVVFSAFFVFSSVFNYLPFYLSAAPLSVSTQLITFMYVSYLVGIFIGPLAGRLSNRIGSGMTMALGSLLLGLSLAATLIQSLPTIAICLIGICGGFFSIHASAVGTLNTRVKSGSGRANSLYVLFYYIGGFAGISSTGWMYSMFGWPGLVLTGLFALIIPLTIGIWEIRAASPVN